MSRFFLRGFLWCIFETEIERMIMDWKEKLAAYLHDPPSKALEFNFVSLHLLFGHEH